MKKFILFFTILFLICFNAFAAFVDYLAPMATTSGIPMNPVRVVDPATGYVTYGPYAANKDKQFTYDEDNTGLNLPAGHYTSNEMIALGGIQNLYWNDNIDDTGFILTATCPSGFYFVSQSNPNYKRPFEMYIVLRAYGWEKRITTGIISGNIYTKYKNLGTVTGPVCYNLSEQNRIELKYSDVTPYFVESTAHTDWPGHDGVHQLWFDMVLVLPGVVENNILKWNGKEYPLVEADDYSAVVTLEFQAIVGGVPQKVKTYNVPFTGYYKKNKQNKEPGYVSMYIHPTAAFGNLNMKDYTRQQIAEMEGMAVVESDKRRDYGFGVFLSSSPSPFEAGDHFKLVKENLDYDEPLNDFNSVEYDVILVDNKDIRNEKRYTGTDSITNKQYSGKKPDTQNSGEKTDPDTSGQSGSSIPEVLLLPSADKVTEDTHSTDVDSWYLSANAYVEIKDNSLVTMEAGRYTSTVYVHVIGFDSI